MDSYWNASIEQTSFIPMSDGTTHHPIPPFDFNNAGTSRGYRSDLLEGYPFTLENGEIIPSPYPYPPSSGYASSSQSTDFGSPNHSPVPSYSTPSPVPSHSFYDTIQTPQTELAVPLLDYLQQRSADSFLSTTSNLSLQRAGVQPLGATDAFRRFVGSPSMRKAGRCRRKPGKPTFDCEIPNCGADFTSQSNLKAHMKSHFGIRDIVCWSCGKAFGIKHVWKRHLKSLSCRRQRSKLLQSTEGPAGLH